ncbi:MAG: radical SAM protein, partial [Chloroflexi bacterium]|nr:radical SAM protein [Chloroflexota bacterium]
MIREIQAKTLLSHSKVPDPWFGIKYTMNLYRGCQHQCIYCDSRSECYQIENLADILVKVNAIELLDRELASKRTVGTVGTGSMNDPYMPVEATIGLTRRALQVLVKRMFPVHVITKSALVLRDADLLTEISRVYAAVSFTITTVDDELGMRLEPGASLVSERLAAMAALSARGILTGVTMMPILPYIEDTHANITAIIERASACGARYLLPGLAVTLRDRQRAYYYAKLDELFPGLRQTYERAYGERYEAPSPRAQ